MSMFFLHVFAGWYNLSKKKEGLPQYFEVHMHFECKRCDYRNVKSLMINWNLQALFMEGTCLKEIYEILSQ